MKTLLCSFIYPAIKQYLKDFFSSLNDQTTKDFDVVIFDDNFQDDLFKYGYDGKIMYNSANLSISELRKFSIDYSIKNDYDLLIFADADDVMGKNRIETIIKLYKKDISFFYNELYLLSDKKIDFFRGKLPSMINDLEEIKEYNFLGMSHTALNIKKEKKNLMNIPLTEKIIAVDWYIHSYILSKGGCGQKVNTKTYYRIYDNNIGGFPNQLTDKKLKIGLKVKKYHYASIKPFNVGYEKLLIQILNLEKKLKNSDFKEKYINYINSKYSDSVFWWENIKTLDKFENGVFDG